MKKVLNMFIKINVLKRKNIYSLKWFLFGFLSPVRMSMYVIINFSNFAQKAHQIIWPYYSDSLVGRYIWKVIYL